MSIEAVEYSAIDTDLYLLRRNAAGESMIRCMKEAAQSNLMKMSSGDFARGDDR